MPNIGSLEPYDGSESLCAYLERLDEYFLSNDIGQAAAGATPAAIALSNRKKVASLITLIGKKAYHVLQDLCKPGLPKERTFEELCALLKGHYQPKKIEVAETFKFHRCVQDDGGTVSEYSARLRGMAADCNFVNFLTRALRDQFISGIRGEDTRRKLLEVDRTFDECYQVATADEAAARESKTFIASAIPTTSQSVNLMQGRKSQHQAQFHDYSSKGRWVRKGEASKSDSYQCFSCGKTDHNRAKCRFRNAVCNKCHRKGHIAKMCHSKHVNLVSEEDTEEIMHDGDTHDKELYTLHDVNSMSHQILVPVKIHGTELDMQLDTGCALSLAPKAFYDEYCSHCPLKPTTKLLSTYTGERVKPLGECEVQLEYGSSTYSLPLLILRDGVCALFGRNWLKDVKLDWKALPGLHYIRPLNSESGANAPKPTGTRDLGQLLEKYQTLFDNQLGVYNGPPVELTVDEKPKFCKVRPVPYALQPRVEKALKKMESEDIIGRVRHAPCAAPIVPVMKRDTDDIRICGDFSITYNACAKMVSYPIPKIEDLHALRGCTTFSVPSLPPGPDIREVAAVAYHQYPNGTLCLQENTKWYTLWSWAIPGNYGHCSCWDSQGNLLFRRHPGCRSRSERSPGYVVSRVQETEICWI